MTPAVEADLGDTSISFRLLKLVHEEICYKKMKEPTNFLKVYTGCETCSTFLTLLENQIFKNCLRGRLLVKILFQFTVFL